MSDKQTGNSLHGITLEMILNQLVTDHGWTELGKMQARHYFSRKLKWDPSDFSGEKSRGGQCLRLPGFVLRPLRHTTSRCYAVRHGYRNDLTPCRMALYFDYASAHATTSSKHPASTAIRGSSYSAPLTLRFRVLLRRVLLDSRRRNTGRRGRNVRSTLAWVFGC
jgi:hypothetical protein